MVNVYPRSSRIAERIQMEIGSMLQRELKDPRIKGLVTVVEVDVSRDLRHAVVYVSVYGSDEDKEKALQGLCHAGPFIKRALFKRMDIKRVPEIQFQLDTRLDEAMKIERLLKESKSSG